MSFTEVKHLYNVYVSHSLSLALEEDVDLAFYGYTSSRNCYPIRWVSRVDVNAGEMKGTSYLHLVLADIALSFHAENVTVIIDLVSKLVAAFQIERVFKVAIHSTHDKYEATILDTGKVLKSVLDFKTDLLSWDDHLRSLFFDIKIVLIELLLALLLVLLLFAIRGTITAAATTAATTTAGTFTLAMLLGLRLYRLHDKLVRLASCRHLEPGVLLLFNWTSRG